MATPGDTDVETAGNVSVNSSSDVHNRAFSAVNGSTATSAATTAPAGQLVVVIIGSNAAALIAGVSVTGRQRLHLGRQHHPQRGRGDR